MKGSLRRVAGAVGVLLLAGCATSPAQNPTPDAGVATPAAIVLRDRAADSTQDSRFSETLRTCRFLRGGRPGVERRQTGRDERLRGCLARRGWQPDGTPTLASLVGPQGDVIPSASATKAH